jgi:pyruvate/2-oxoglutarate dehydrogenase complex dihydrolipoamide dehydrogenase (E3) component
MVGGGYIAAEFSHIAVRAGASVTVLQRAERMLTRFEPEPVGWLMEKFSDIGVEVRTGTAVEAIEGVGSGFRVRARAGTKRSRSKPIAWFMPLAVCPISTRLTCRRPGSPSKTAVSS